MKSMGISVNPIHWNFEKHEPKPSCPNKEQIVQLILKTKIEYQKKLLNKAANGEDFTSESLVKDSDSQIKNISVDDFYQNRIKTLKDKGKIGNSDVYLHSYNSLKNFNSCKQLKFTFNNINIRFLNRYENWLRSNGNKETTISVLFRSLRATYNKAIEDKAVSRNKNPFTEFKISKFNIKTIKRALSKSEILQIMEYNNQNKTEFQKLAHTVFCFSYLCGGISFVDIANLSQENIKNDRLIYKRQKTGGIINLPLSEKAKEYIDLYSDLCTTIKYLYPILNAHIHITPLQKSNRIKKVRKQINTELRSIGKELNISMELTTYVARHSFATILKNSGVNIALISEALGHSALSTTQIYLDSFDNTQFNDAMKHLI
jgi:site-specific recombinase XerD